MLEILINGERAGRVWKEARSIEVRDPDSPEDQVALISLSHYHKGQSQVHVRPWHNTRLDVELHQFPGSEINIRALNSQMWSFDPYGGAYSREGGDKAKLENLIKSRDLLSNIIERIKASQGADSGERRLIITNKLGYEFKNFQTKAEMIRSLALTDPDEIQKIWAGAPGDITGFMSPRPGLTQVNEDQEESVPEEEPERDTSHLVGSRAWIEAELGPVEDLLTFSCPHCGSKVPETARCLNCGKSLEAEE